MDSSSSRWSSFSSSLVFSYHRLPTHERLRRRRKTTRRLPKREASSKRTQPCQPENYSRHAHQIPRSATAR
ncbi:unnamed protein product [Musa acuminata subsp. malaccensis]|uniref:(wild Malaysian banana) hypothetical protein n=1 Tax=Musa acuminata subsp. malaccensis TaxID=214687 RepID=A0A804K9K7_MUSAM|nr:unnamed protein product [Musa acuminata subsp. malaccensis]